jgi:hypothetical protein
MNYNYLSLGYDCSPSSALKTLNLRNFALPFDWIVSNIDSFDSCFKEGFVGFHTELKYNKKNLIDKYGFVFPHDYPLEDSKDNENNVGDGMFGEQEGKIIIEDWNKYYIIVKEKYDRRIKRFLNIVNSDVPIIALCRFTTYDVMRLKELFIKYFNKHNIIFINSTTEKSNIPYIFNVNTEENNIWSESKLWKKVIDEVISLNILKSL